MGPLPHSQEHPTQWARSLLCFKYIVCAEKWLSKTARNDSSDTVKIPLVTLQQRRGNGNCNVHRTKKLGQENSLYVHLSVARIQTRRSPSHLPRRRLALTDTLPCSPRTRVKIREWVLLRNVCDDYGQEQPTYQHFEVFKKRDGNIPLLSL